MNNLKELTKIIQEAVPEIMELGWGCHVEHKETGNIAKVIRYVEVNNEIEIDCLAYMVDADSAISLGRDITLEDVLIALREKDTEWACTCTGIFLRLGGFEIGGCSWELNKPLHEQSPKTIDFLHGLLVKE
jgi:hypothetical protein